MTMYLSEALKMLPFPAALFEHPSFDFVSLNEVGAAFIAEIGIGDGGDPDFAWVGIDEAEVTRQIEANGEFVKWIEEHQYAVFASVLPKPAYVGRPPLILVTTHQRDRDSNELMHLRARSVLTQNEHGMRAIEATQNALNLLATTLQIDKDMLTEFNENAAAVFKAIESGTVSAKALDAHRRDML